jgi:hypothetical protein
VLTGVLQAFALRGVPCWRNNTGAMRNPAGRLVRFGLVGSADVFAVLPPYGRMCAVETKTPGNRPTPAQVEFLERVRASGGVAVWVTTPAQVLGILAALADDPDLRFEIDGTVEGPSDG